MEKIEIFKREAEDKIKEIEGSSDVLEPPVSLIDFKSFLASLKVIFEMTENNEIKSEIIKRIIAEIQIGPNFVRLHYLMGDPDQVSLLGINEAADAEKRKAIVSDGLSSSKMLNLVQSKDSVAPTEHGCSNSLTSGAP